ncbi:MAG: methionine adenosyltransferase [Truepera sp.]|nr:methionine adenosyltransferase [Truepera sp.]
MTILTSESVTEGHPDKLADRISDAILDAILAIDPNARVAAETTLSVGLALIAGEITCRGYVDIQKIVRETLREVGYTKSEYGIDATSAAVLVAINEQSPDIARGVNRAQEADSGEEYDQLGAGDQGIMFGYACDETPELMPLPITLAHRLTYRLSELRKSGALPYLRPDGKAQVTVAYDGIVPKQVTVVVVSAQHDENVNFAKLQQEIESQVIRAVIPERYFGPNTRVLINPTGRFVVGGPQSDTGLTGRKIIIDTYGGSAPHGGGAFSGKDATKVDRSASYYARYIAKNVLAAGLARRCQVQLAYAIGVAHPISLAIETFGTGAVDDEVLAQAVAELFDARPAAIIEQLGLRAPIYKATSCYGHFGRTGFPWERADQVAALQAAVARLAGGR